MEENRDLIEVTDKFMIDIKTSQGGLETICRTSLNNSVENLKELLARDKVYEVRTVILEDDSIEAAVGLVTDILKKYPKVPYRLIKVHLNGLKEEQKIRLEGKLPTDAYMDKLYTIIRGES